MEHHCAQFERSRIKGSKDMMKNVFNFDCAYCAHLRTFSKTKYAKLLSSMRRSFGVIDLKIGDGQRDRPRIGVEMPYTSVDFLYTI